jgi:hypothetical protein
MDIGKGRDPRREEPDEALRYALLASRLGVSFDPSPRRGWARVMAVEGGESDSGMAHAIRDGRAAFVGDGASRRLLIAPAPAEAEQLAALLERRPDLASDLTVTLPAVIRRFLTECAAPRLVENAVNRLDRRRPDFSARRLLTVAQGIACIVLVLLVRCSAGAVAGSSWRAST